MIETEERGRSTNVFGTLPVSGPMSHSLKAMRYHVPTPIQERSIPILRQGGDVLGQAQTGTGKTAGFGIPMIESIGPASHGIQGIVLVPTRELCLQVADEIRRLGTHTGVRVVAVYGGVGLQRQIEGVKRAHIVVGTPGRVEDLIQRSALKLGSVRFAVLDEADRMLDVGFLPSIERILGHLPSKRQTALFSATIPAEVRGLAQRHMSNPITVEIDPERATVEEIDQRFERVADGDKLSALCDYLDDPACYLALVFRRTTYRVDRLARDLARMGYSVAPLHGRRSQNQRERVLADLKSCKLQALIATDIAARGLDIAGLTHVFNFDLPDEPDMYVHRIGRTGRAGASGISVTFISAEDEVALRVLQRHLAGDRARSLVAKSPKRNKQPSGAANRPGSARVAAVARPPSRDSVSSRPSQNGHTSQSRRNRGRWSRGPIRTA
jgi:ATP-dependent RNA helicase DeaD